MPTARKPRASPPSEGARSGGSPSRNSAERTNERAFAASAPRKSSNSTSSPPRTGPAATWMFRDIPIQAFARISCSGRTSAGRALRPAGPNNVSNVAARATSPRSTGNDGSSQAIVPKIAAWPRSQVTISDRCSTRSTIAPARGPRNLGIDVASSNAPTDVPVPRAPCTCPPCTIRTSAVNAIPSPMCEIVLAASSLRNAGASRIGLVTSSLMRRPAFNGSFGICRKRVATVNVVEPSIGPGSASSSRRWRNACTASLAASIPSASSTISRVDNTSWSTSWRSVAAASIRRSSSAT